MVLVSVDAREIAKGVRGKWNEIEDGISTIAPRGKTSFPLTFQEEGVWGALRVGSSEVNPAADSRRRKAVWQMSCAAGEGRATRTSSIWVRFRQQEVSNFKPHPASTFFRGASRSQYLTGLRWNRYPNVCGWQAECLHISHRMSRLGWRHARQTSNTKPPERDESRAAQRSGRKMMRLVVVFPHALKPKKQRNSTELIFSKHIKHSYEKREFKCVCKRNSSFFAA